ncbi:invasion associated locus B family protein [Mesorhizobium koreense]|jgi:invasion protein IalB|uniref:invasion associated locus B family protein n=1 Tax=Mesorhizobium koreense TaxID=3074855 RepID=UPI00287BB8A1|nr:invasion associated locus B family protein [Mesorhizobium sp. WR6]
MTRHTNQAGRLTVAAAGLAAAMVAFAPAAQAQDAPNQPPRGWFKACSKQQDVDICNVQNIIMADTGQLMTGISMIDIKGKVNRKVFQVTVPTGRMIPPGVGVQVDGGKAQKLDYVICFPDRCVAEAQLTDALVASFKKGQKLTLTSINFQNQPNPIDISLAGFTGAFDGPPLKESDLQDRQKKLQDFVAKNNEDFAKKLKEEQDKAKQGKN